jgi:hypothetical protein
LDSTDTQAFSEIATSIKEQEQANYKTLQKSNAAARLAGHRRDPLAFCRFSAEANRILVQGLSQLDSQLSAVGRKSLETYLDRQSVHQYAPGTHTAWFVSTGPAVKCDSN